MKAGVAINVLSAMQMTVWHKALVASLGLHGLIFGLLLSPAEREPVSTSPATVPLQASVVTRNPQRSAPPLAPATSSNETKPATALVDANIAELPPVGATPPSSSIAELPVDKAATVTASRVAETSAANGLPNVQLSPAAVRQAVSTYAGGYRRELATGWLENCLIEQKERGSQDCSGQRIAVPESPNLQAARKLAQGAFASVTRPQQQARLSREFMRTANELMPPLMEQGGLLGDIATYRYHMSREYYAYLNGNANAGTAAFVVANMPGQINIAGSGYLQPLCNPMPCVWNFTGFEVTRPEAWQAEVPFPVKTTLFGSNR